MSQPSSSSSQPSRSAGRWIFLVVKIAVSLGLLVLLFRQTDISAIGERMRAMDLRWMAAALAHLRHDDRHQRLALARAD